MRHIRLSAIVLVVLLLLPFNFVRQELAGDARSYFSHATTLLFNKDLSYDNDLRPGAKHPYGASLWFAAVAYPFSRVDIAQGHPIVSDRAAHHGSWTMFGMSFASLLAFAVGFLLFATSLRRLAVEVSGARLWLLLVGAGIGGIWSHFSILYAHAVEFLSIALVFYFVACRGLDSRRVRSGSFWTPVAVAFALAVRPMNIGLLLLPLAIISLQRLRGRQVSRSFLYGSAGWGSAAALLLAGNMAFYGQPYPTVTTTYGVDLFRSGPPPSGVGEALSGLGAAMAPLGDVVEALGLSGKVVPLVERPIAIAGWYGQRVLELPQFLWTLVTTSEFGLLWWTPVLVMGPVVAVLLFTRRGNSFSSITWLERSLGLLAVAGVYAVPLAVVFRWQSWGSGWGFRYLLSAMPLSILLVLAFLDRIPKNRRRTLEHFLTVTAIFSIVSQMFFYTTGEFRPVPGTVNSFGKADNNSLPGLGFDVLRGMFSLQAWAAAFAGRSTGFLGLQVIGEYRATRLLTEFGLDDAFRYSIDEALDMVRDLPDAVRRAYNLAILGVPAVHLFLVRAHDAPLRGLQGFRCTVGRMRSRIKRIELRGDTESAGTGSA